MTAPTPFAGALLRAAIAAVRPWDAPVEPAGVAASDSAGVPGTS